MSVGNNRSPFDDDAWNATSDDDEVPHVDGQASIDQPQPPPPQQQQLESQQQQQQQPESQHPSNVSPAAITNSQYIHEQQTSIDTAHASGGIHCTPSTTDDQAMIVSDQAGGTSASTSDDAVLSTTSNVVNEHPELRACAVCSIPVHQGIELSSFYFHDICAVCSMCHHAVSEEKGFSVHEQTVTCTDCAQNVNVPCTVCGFIVLGSEAQWVGKHAYHADCIKCHECGKSYRSGRTFFALGDQDSGDDCQAATSCNDQHQHQQDERSQTAAPAIVCRVCHAKIQSEREASRLVACAYCLESLPLGEAVQIGGKAWHPHCAHCTVCGSVIKKGTSISMQRGALWCATCTRESLVQAVENRKALDEAAAERELQRVASLANQLSLANDQLLRDQQRLDAERAARLEAAAIEAATLEAETVHVCLLCHDDVARRNGLMLASHVWHIECAECCRCSAALDDSTFFALLDSRMWCVSCASAEVRRTELERLEREEEERRKLDGGQGADADQQQRTTDVGATASTTHNKEPSSSDVATTAAERGGGGGGGGGLLSRLMRRIDRVALATRASLSGSASPAASTVTTVAESSTPDESSCQVDACVSPDTPNDVPVFETLSDDEKVEPHV
jgi:hypothetical protein